MGRIQALKTHLLYAGYRTAYPTIGRGPEGDRKVINTTICQGYREVIDPLTDTAISMR